MQTFNKGIIHRSANKIIAFSPCSQMVELRFRTGKIIVMADGVGPAPPKWPKTGPKTMHPTGMGTCPRQWAMSPARTPCPPQVATLGGVPLRSASPPLQDAGAQTRSLEQGQAPPALQAPQGTWVLSRCPAGTSLKCLPQHTH